MNSHSKRDIVEAVDDKINDNLRYLMFKNNLDDSNVDLTNANYDIDNYNAYKRVYKKRLDQVNKRYKVVNLNERAIDTINKPDYKILEYTNFFGQTKYCQLFDNKSYFEQEQALQQIYLHQCQYKNCKFTCKKQEIGEADAVIFHEGDLNNHLSDDSHYLDTVSNGRDPKQIWILWNDEANRVNGQLDRYGFNWTLTYRDDAETSDCAYGCKYKKSKTIDSEAENEFIESLRIEFHLRKKSALWFVSNCNSLYRVDFAIKLKKYFEVNVIGLCSRAIEQFSNYSLFSVTNWLVRGFYFLFTNFHEKFGERVDCKANSLCEASYVLKNMFYLSFESKNCSNYITEKFWRILRTGLIPVVIQPSKQFYESIAPKDSYIHAQDFNHDPQLLANYLKLVSNDVKIYMKYFMWKYSYDIAYSAQKAESRRMCELCTNLNTETSTIYYTSISNWFNKECIIN